MDFSWNGAKRKFRSRSETRAANNLGIINLTNEQNTNVFRDQNLEKLDQYYERRQYSHLPPWEQSTDSYGLSLKPRQRCPRLNVGFAKTLSQRLTSKLVGTSVFPEIIQNDFPEDELFLKAILKFSNLQAAILEPTRRMLNTGSVYIRYWINAGKFSWEWYDAKYCYPAFGESGELEAMTVKYVYSDKNDKDKNGNFKKKWFKLDFLPDRDIAYNNPEYHQNQEPQFEIENEFVHDMGFIQGEWCKTCEVHNSIDGYGLTQDITEFIDEMNYSLSQSSTSVSFNQDPQLTFSGMTEDELSEVMRSSMKSWNLGLKGQANFLEAGLNGVEKAMDLRDKVRLNIQDISRIVLLDPDKIVGSAQSAKAMEILHGPLKDLVDELRMPMEMILKKLITKMALSVLIANNRGLPVPISIPPGYKPSTIDFDLEWPPIFQQTMEDLQKKVQVVSAATAANLISRETGTRYLAKDFKVENVEEEIQKIASQPVINPWGGF